LKSDNSDLKADNSDLKADKKQLRQQLEINQNLHEELKLQWNATCVASTEELLNNYQLKLKEVGDLNEKLQQKEEENKSLKKNVEILLGF
jgi:hypothetical protein